MRIAEIYKSIQGEGLLTGAESVFVRASGCNLRCGYCDTPYTSWRPEGDDLSVDEIVSEVLQLGAAHVVVTGGEPMLFAELIRLCDRLHQHGLHITIETAGTLHLPLKCDLMSISPKLSNSTPAAERAPRWRARHERTRNTPDVVARLIEDHQYQLKFVIGAPADCEEVEAYLDALPVRAERSRVLLMPEGTDVALLAERGAWLEPYCQAQGYVFCPRRHIEWFGLVRGT